MNSDHPLIVAVDTATSCSSVALTRGNLQQGELLASLKLNSKLTHSRRLLTAIDWLLSENNIIFSDIDAVAVGLGPGSFTGLRIAMATVKGLATAMNVPLLGVSTLDGLAANCSGTLPLCALIDARKQEVYRRWYQRDDRGVYRPDGKIAALSSGELIQELAHPTLLVGDGMFAFGEQLQEGFGEHIVTAPRSLHYPSATAIGFLCCERLEENDIMDLDSAVPLYVRASDAELNLVKKS